MTAKEKLALQLAKTTGNNNGGNLPTQQPAKTIADYIKAMTPEIAKALPSHLKPERLARIVTTEIRRNPKLMQCTRESLLGALMLSAQLGLEPGPLGHVYFIPYNNKKQGIIECQFILGYKGMIDLARRSGNIQSIMAETVYENDVFEFEYGLNPNLIHKPTLNDRGKAVAWYAVAKFIDGGYQMKVMGRPDIERSKSRSQTGNSQYSPWATDYDEMAKKTVVRAMFKYLPVSNEIMRYSEKDAVVKSSPVEDEGEDFIDLSSNAPITTFLESDVRNTDTEPVENKQQLLNNNQNQYPFCDLEIMRLSVDFPSEYKQACLEISDPTTAERCERVKKRVKELIDIAAAGE